MHVAPLGGERGNKARLRRFDRRADIRNCDIDGEGSNRRSGKRPPEAEVRPQATLGGAGLLDICREQPPVDRALHRGWRLHRLIGGRDRHEMDFPFVDELRKGGIVVDAARGRDPLVRRQHAQNILGRDEVVAAEFRFVVVHGSHLSRHSLSFIRLRRSHVRIVFSGTLKRAASSA